MVTLFASLGCSSTLERGVLENLLPSTLFPSPRVTATESIELAVNFDTQDLGNEGRPTSRQTDGRIHGRSNNLQKKTDRGTGEHDQQPGKARSALSHFLATKFGDLWILCCAETLEGGGFLSSEAAKGSAGRWVVQQGKEVQLVFFPIKSLDVVFLFTFEPKKGWMFWKQGVCRIILEFSIIDAFFFVN